MGVIELCGIVAALSAGCAGPFAVARWCIAAIEKRIEESETDTTAKIDVVEKALTSKIEHRDHRVNNLTSRVDSIEREHQKHIERTVKLETNYNNLEKGQVRIEHQLDKMESESAKGRAEIIDSIRELRSVSLKKDQASGSGASGRVTGT